MTDMLDYMENDKNTFKKLARREASKRQSFKVGKVVAVNDDLTYDLEVYGHEENVKNVTHMSGDVCPEGQVVLFLDGDEKTPIQILGPSPWLVLKNNG